MTKQFALTLALLMGIGGFAANSVQAQDSKADPKGGNELTEPGSVTGFLTHVDELGGFVEVDGVRYAVDEDIDLSEISAGQRVHLLHEPSAIASIPQVTEITPADG